LHRGKKNTPFSAPEDPSETTTVKRTDPTPHRSNGRSMSDHSDPDSHDFMSDHSNPDPHGFLVWDETREEVVGVDEGQIALALLKGRKELLSEMVESQWGPVHLFDLCLLCDHLGMALALAAHGVPGCILEDYHLGPISQLPRLRPCDCEGNDQCKYCCFSCRCQGWDTCEFCCWAFPVEQGIWMEDSDADLLHWDQRQFVGAIPAAHEAAATPLTRAMLDICSLDVEIPFSGSPKAMARLLDIAILTGNQKAAVSLAKKCQLRPLRRWTMRWRRGECWEAARTALRAGANFQNLMVELDCEGSRFGENIPFPQAMFLNSKLEAWQEMRHLLPRCHDLWRPRVLHKDLGEFFFERPHGPDGGRNLKLDKIRAAEDAGVDLRFLFVVVHYGDGLARATLLDVAIWCGQPDWAEACVDRGIELNDADNTLGLHKRVLRGEELILSLTFTSRDDPFLDLDVAPSEAEIAAAAASRAWLKRLWKSESSQKGIVLYQMMLKMFKGRSFPTPLVQEILTFSMPRPLVMDQLDLRDWMGAICGRPTSVHAATDCNTADVEEPEGVRDNGETGATSGDATETDVKATEDLMTALCASRDQVPALNVDGVCLFRLTRMGTCPHVTDLLLDATGPLQPLHTRVLEAGCEVNPSWNLVKVLFVPLTEGQMVELQGLAAHGYELSNEYHLLALQSDEELIADALRSKFRNKNRPKLKKVGPEIHPDQDTPLREEHDVDEDEDGPMLVLETGIRTDSDVGFPSYPTSSSW